MTLELNANLKVVKAHLPLLVPILIVITIELGVTPQERVVSQLELLAVVIKEQLTRVKGIMELMAFVKEQMTRQLQPALLNCVMMLLTL